MDDGTTLMFDLPGFRVVECREDSAGQRLVVVMGADAEHACPGCGVLAVRPYDVRESVVKDLPFGQRPLIVVWRKRRYLCLEAACGRRVFTESSVQIPPRHRLTGRLRAKLEAAASGSARSCGRCCPGVPGVGLESAQSLAGQGDGPVRQPASGAPARTG